MDILRAMNMMLIAAGEAKVDSIDADHPLQASLLDVLENVSQLEQSKGWWFNEYETTLVPDTNGNIILPESVVRIKPRGTTRSFVKRGQFLMDKFDRSMVFDRSVDATLAEHWEFEELPETFAMYVAQLAALQAGTSYDADQGRLAAIAQAVDFARQPMMKEHIDNARVNMLDTPSMTNKMIGVRHQRYGVNQ